MTLQVAVALGGARMAPMAWVAPPLGDRARLARLLVAMLATALVAPLLAAQPEPAALGSAFVVELLVGLALGLLMALPFAAAEAAGVLYDRALGPWRWLHGDRGVVSQAYRLLALALFAALDGPSLALRALQRSYLALPPGHALPLLNAELLVRVGTQLVAAAAALAAPGLAALLLADVAGALLARAQPALGRAVELLGVRALLLVLAAAAALLVSARTLTPLLADAASLRLP
jgi:flagellar biosynthesis protein FliR